MSQQQEQPNQGFQRDPNMVYVKHPAVKDPIPFPKDMAPEKIQEAMDNFSISTIPQGGTVADPQGDSGIDWWSMGSEIGLSVTGAALGQRLTQGMPAPVQFAGTTTGAAVGTAMHFLGQDFLEGDELDYEKAVKESLISAGFDVATLGAQKLLPDRAWLRMMRTMGINPTKTASNIIADLGSTEAAEQAQAFLRDKGLGLLPSQTRAQGAWFSRLKEKIGRLGFMSRSSFEEFSGAVDDAVRDEFDNLFTITNNTSVSTVADNLDLVFRTAKTALSNQYEKNLDGLLTRVSPAYTNANPLKLQLSKILSENNIKGLRADGTLDTYGSKLQPETISFIQNNFAKLVDPENPFVSFNAKSIIELEKQMTAAQRQALDAGQNTAASELGRIAGQLKESYATMLERIDPKVAKEYVNLKNTFKKGMEDIFPEITGDKIQKAIENGTLYPIANAIVSTGTSARQVQELMSGITRTYGRLRYTNPKGYKQVLADAGLPESPNDFKKQVRQSFLIKNFPDLLSPDEPLSKSAKKLAKLFIGEADERTKAIFGEQYKDIKKLANIVDVVSRDARGNIADLASLSQQYQAAGNIVSTIGALTAGGSLATADATTGAVAAAILLTPHYMTKAVMNPKLGDNLLKIGTHKFDNFQKRAELVNLSASEFLQTLTEEEMAEVMTFVEGRFKEAERKALVEQTKNERVF